MLFFRAECPMMLIAALVVIWLFSGIVAASIIKQIRPVKLADVQQGPISLVRIWRGRA
jgi:hypothetical protein